MCTTDVCLLYGKYSESCLQLPIFLYIWLRQDTEKYGTGSELRASSTRKTLPNNTLMTQIQSFIRMRLVCGHRPPKLAYLTTDMRLLLQAPDFCLRNIHCWALPDLTCPCLSNDFFTHECSLSNTPGICKFIVYRTNVIDFSTTSETLHAKFFRLLPCRPHTFCFSSCWHLPPLLCQSLLLPTASLSKSR